MPNEKTDYQTPPQVCDYMVSLLPAGIKTVLEPTPGQGNLLSSLLNYDVTAPEDYFLLQQDLRFDAVVMNPPFSDKTILNLPAGTSLKGMQFGYKILFDCMEKSSNVVALMPWFTVLDSDTRMKKLMDFGLISVTALPRVTFNYARIQTCIFQLKKGYTGITEFRRYSWKNPTQYAILKELY